jgi:hypothetical protein
LIFQQLLGGSRSACFAVPQISSSKKPQKPSFGDEWLTHSCPGMATDFQPSWAQTLPPFAMFIGEIAK